MATDHVSKITVPVLTARKHRGPKIAALTAYDATLGRLLDEGGADILLVGDSLGMVVQGLPNTLPVTVDEICYHARAVARVARRAHVLGDLPFMSYQVSPEQALMSAGKLVKDGGCESVKLEGGRRIADTVARVVGAGIPVVGHVGLTPQSLHAFGGFRIQGKREDEALGILDDARSLEQAGVFAIVVEGVPAELGRRITEAVNVPTIGIGAGPHCDGQVLVCYDFLGMYRELAPKFVKRYAEVGETIVNATRRYVAEVQANQFPSAEQSFGAAGQSATAAPTAAEAPVPDVPLGYGPPTDRGS